MKVQDDCTSSFAPPMVLPEPTHLPPDPMKKPHAKKQPIGHIPRPRNAFILFRCDYVRQEKIPAEVEKDHRNISRIVGRIWRQMNDEQREPWVSMADREKVAHSKRYPGYRFSGGVKSKRGDNIPHETQKPQDHHFGDFLYRSASCPPGTLRVPQADSETCNGCGTSLKTRDDMARRPSRVTLYQSTPHQPTSPVITQEELTDTQQYFSEFGKEDCFQAVPSQEHYTDPEGWGATFDKDSMSEERGLEPEFCGSRINVHPYPIPGPDDPPEWDVSPIQPQTWSTFQIDQSSSTTGEIFGTDANRPFFIDPFLSTLPPLPHSGDSFSPLGFALQPSFATFETGPSSASAHSPLERWKLPDTPPEYVQNIAKCHSNMSYDPLFRNKCYCDTDSSEHPQKSSFSDLSAYFRPALDGEWDNQTV